MRICVFCGSASGLRPIHAQAARATGKALAERGVELVYGGGRVGLMGIVADATLEAGGHAIGVIPRALASREIAHDGLSELHVVAGMHERKALMASLSDAFLTLPGGIGTFEEFFEVLSWAALGIHQKPMGLLNLDGYYAPAMLMFQNAIDEGFLNPETTRRLIIDADPHSIVERLVSPRPRP